MNEHDRNNILEETVLKHFFDFSDKKGSQVIRLFSA